MKQYRTKNVIVRCGADLFLPLACVFGGYVVFHGSTSPGGGFQGGVLISSAILLIYLGHGAGETRQSVSQLMLHNSETMAEIVYILIAMLGVFTGTSFCFNFIFLGRQMETSMLMNDAVGFHVTTGLIGLLLLMLSTLKPREEEEALDFFAAGQQKEEEGKEEPKC